MPVGFDGNVNNTQQLQKLKMLKGMQGKGTQVKSTKNVDMTKNGSIFNMVSNNQTKANGAQPAMRRPASPMAGTRGADTTNGVVSANTKASVDDIQNTTSTTGTKAASSPSLSDIKSGKVPDEWKKVDIGNIDFDNLSGLSDVQLSAAKNDLKEALDNDCPFFLRVPFEQKLHKVESEIQQRGEKDGDKVSEDNKKAEEKSNEALTRSAEDGAKEAGSGASAAQKGTEQTNKMSQQTVELEKNIKSEQAKMLKTQTKAEKSIEKNIKASEKEIKNINQLNEQNEAISQEIEELNEKAAATRAAGGENADAEANSIAEEIQTRSAQSAVNTAKIGKSTINMHKYATANNKTVRTMTKANKAYVKNMASAQTQIQQNEQKASGFMETMEKINDISSKVAMAGTVTKYTGMLLGKVPWTAAVGAYMEVAGTIAETAGNYGVAAANIGKTAVYAAEGNIMGALTSAGTAIMSGATAVQGTKQIGAAADAAKKAGEGVSKEAVVKAGENAAKGSVKDMTKDITTELDKQVGDKAAKGVLTKVGEDGAKHFADTGVKGFVNGVHALNAGQSTTQIMMGLGSALSSAAAMFQNNDQGVATTQTVYKRNAGLTRRKIA